MRDSGYARSSAKFRSVRVFTLPPTSPTLPTATPHLTRLYAGLIIFLPPILFPKTCFQGMQLPVATIVCKRAVVV